MAIKITTDKVITRVKPQGKKFTLKELQEQVGGYIELLPLKSVPTFNLSDAIMVLNEEGKLTNLPINTIATDLYLYNYTGMMGIDMIVGDVLICNNEEIE